MKQSDSHRCAVEPLEQRRLLSAPPLSLQVPEVLPPADNPTLLVSDPATSAGQIQEDGPLATSGLGDALRSALVLAYSRYAAYARTWRPEQFADFTSASGPWVVGSQNSWFAGFTPGVMWELSTASARDGNLTRAWKLRGEAWSRRVMTSNIIGEDVGFRVLTGLEPWAAQLEAEGRFSSARAVASRMEEEARFKLSTKWDEEVGAFETTWRQSSNPEGDFGVLIDQTYDLSLLQWLAGRVAAGDPGEASLIRTRVLRHAQAVAGNLVRADGSSYQWGYFNSTSGQFVQGETYQGYANESTWSRGHAWGILGFSEIARKASLAGGAADPDLVTLARTTAGRMADWFLAHLPADFVPYWDFDDPAIPNAPRDSSAAAIAAKGLLTLAAVPGLSAEDASRYFTAAESILGSLAGSYLSSGRPEASVLIHGSGNVPAGGAVDRGLIYGDYFFLRAANQWFATPAAIGQAGGGTSDGGADAPSDPGQPLPPAPPADPGPQLSLGEGWRERRRLERVQIQSPLRRFILQSGADRHDQELFSSRRISLWRWRFNMQSLPR